MHGMVFYIFFRYGTECAQPHIQGHKHFFATHVLNFLQQFFCKMKAGCRCCSGTGIPVIYSLIPFLIFQFFRNIGRQRDFTQTVQDFFKHPGKLKADDPASKVRMIYNCP